MLGLFKGKNKGNLLHSPCNGKVVPITEVPDSTFADDKHPGNRDSDPYRS